MNSPYSDHFDLHLASPLHSNTSTKAAVSSRTIYWLWKGFLDRAVAFVLLIPGLPMIAFLVVLIRLNSRGPGVYRQTRVGKDGRIFTMYKLRSMRMDAEAKSGPVWSAAGTDPRVTRLGYWLRRLHLDELPQLINVIKGEMSMVGPRPERPEFVKILAVQIDGYRDRLTVLPGITGLAQVNLPPDTDLDSVRRKLILDCEYIETASMLFDLRLVLCTIFRCFGLRGGRAVSLLGLFRRVELPVEMPPVGGMEDAVFATPETILPDATDTPSHELPKPKRRHRPSDSQILSAH